MLLSLKYKFLFVHIAKTGGTSVRATLNRYRWRDPWYYPMFMCSRLSSLSGHRIGAKLPRHARAICAYEMLPRELYDSLFKFAFVRNPWDLQVSSFHHIGRERPHLMEGREDFESFLRWKLDPERPHQYHIDTSIELQSDYLVDLHGKVIVDFVGRYERLQDDFRQVCEHVALPAPKLAHKRQAKDRGSFRKYYTDDTAALVAEHFKADIDMFGYTFDGD
ncbi:sulfotransferase family 2 domain-containing protein [uncultured Desulfuromonas sp.]|uniref:sulfotransferase family 2 domain-containing protein n=1 Tax=uncultured Desulfuromonas sp. TaxID=181013 RepID=UPI00261F8F0D|nr:sulfotransferase family 2 domain-containing protein [uncultured Desulfuromonas sp.]